MIRILFHWFKASDLWRLNPRIGIHKFVILARILYSYAFGKSDEIGQFLNAIPTYQNQDKSLRKSFEKKLVNILSLLIVVIKESQLKGELIDNRIKQWS